MTKVYDVVAQVFRSHGEPLDGFVDEVAEQIVEDNGEDLSDEEIAELAEQFLEEGE